MVFQPPILGRQQSPGDTNSLPETVMKVVLELTLTISATPTPSASTWLFHATCSKSAGEFRNKLGHCKDASDFPQVRAHQIL